MAGEFMAGILCVAKRPQVIDAAQHYAIPAPADESLIERGGTAGPSSMPIRARVVASCGQNLYLFQMIPQIDKIPRRDAIAANKRLFGLSFH
jgi:hypothetical protein